jgi:triosephosphate isomerase (TIM)
MRQKFVAGNWKMNGSKTLVDELVQGIVNYVSVGTNSHCILFPPALYINQVAHLIAGNDEISLGIQNSYPSDSGAYTGEITALMAKEFGCQYVLVGHSERRALFNESDEFIAKKFHHAKENGMIPVLCVGETEKQRGQGLTQEVIARQLRAVLEYGMFDGAIVAYEPVWAIGTGITATPGQAQQVHEFIRALIAEHNQKVAQNLSILYGGSVNESNASALFAMPDIDGGLVGGACLKTESFVEIVSCIK